MTQKLHLLIWSYGNFPVYDGLKVEMCSLFTGDKTESVQWVFWGTHCITVLRITFKPCDNFSSLSCMAFKDPFFCLLLNTQQTCHYQLLKASYIQSTAQLFSFPEVLRYCGGFLKIRGQLHKWLTGAPLPSPLPRHHPPGAFTDLI